MTDVQRARNDAIVNHLLESEQSRRCRERTDAESIQKVGEVPDAELPRIRKADSLACPFDCPGPSRDKDRGYYT